MSINFRPTERGTVIQFMEELHQAQEEATLDILATDLARRVIVSASSVESKDIVAGESANTEARNTEENCAEQAGELDSQRK